MSPNSPAPNLRHRIRKLWPLDLQALKSHLLRLDADTRHERFGFAVSDSFMTTYAATTMRLGVVSYGAFDGHQMHGFAELRPAGLSDCSYAEAAVVVERPYQHLGLGSRLMDRIVTAAQNRSFSHLAVICQRGNGPMLHLAGKFGAALEGRAGEVLGDIHPHAPTPGSLLDEGLDDAAGFCEALLEWWPNAASVAATIR